MDVPKRLVAALCLALLVGCQTPIPKELKLPLTRRTMRSADLPPDLTIIGAGVTNRPLRLSWSYDTNAFPYVWFAVYKSANLQSWQCVTNTKTLSIELPNTDYLFFKVASCREPQPTE